MNESKATEVAANKKAVEKVAKRGLKERRAYIILVLICVVLSVSTFFLVVNRIEENNHKWCDLMVYIDTQPRHKPVGPNAKQELKAQQEGYQKIDTLRRALGC